MSLRRPSLRSTVTKLDLLSLRLFLAICEVKHLGKAAEREHIAASAVTKRIQELEELFGVKLLYRNPRGVAVTPMGAALANHAREILGAVERLRGELSEFAEGVRGHVRVYANASVIVEFLAVDLRQFLVAHSGVEIDLHEQLSHEVVHAVATGAADLGIYASALDVDPSLETHLYRKDRLVAVLSVDHPLALRAELTFEEFLDLDLIGVREASAIMSVLEQQAQASGRSAHFRYRATTNEVARSLVGAGLGATLQPEGMVRAIEAVLGLRTVPISAPWTERELRLCFKRGASLPAPAKALAQYLIGKELNVS